MNTKPAGTEVKIHHETGWSKVHKICILGIDAKKSLKIWSWSENWKNPNFWFCL